MWWLYLLRCGDGTLYCGISNDVDKRVAAHRAGKGARYTRGRAPLRLLHKEEIGTRGDALRRELSWKKLSRTEKLARVRAERLRVKAAAAGERAAPTSPVRDAKPPPARRAPTAGRRGPRATSPDRGAG